MRIRSKPQMVAFIGNMNNSHFAIVRYLRDAGVEADLLLSNEEYDHFHPKADTFDLGFQQYVRQLTWGDARSFLQTSPYQIESDLTDYSTLFGCGLAPAYCTRASRMLDVFIPYGGDIWSATRFKLASPHILASVWYAAYSQRRAISRCRILQMCHCPEMYEQRIKKFMTTPGQVRWMFAPPVVYHPDYTENKLPDILRRTHWGNEFERIRQSSDLMLFSSVRHHWSDLKTDPSNKGTDIMLKGVSQFMRKHPDIRLSLVTMEYGMDVAKSKKLISDLGMASVVKWFPMMYRKDLMAGLMLSDLAFGEFIHSWDAGGCIYEALVARKPIVMKRDVVPSTHCGKHPLFPVVNARAPDDIVRALEDCVATPRRMREFGEEGHCWYVRAVVDEAVQRYLEYINQKTHSPNLSVGCAL